MPEKGKGEIKPPVKIGERIAKRIAGAGLCSRREADQWIADGLVRVNGQVITSPVLDVTLDDKITVRGKSLPAPLPPRLFAFHKPVGLVVTQKDEKGRQTVFSGLPKSLPRLVSVGRLDLNSEGLLLLTTSGELARYLELPKTGMSRVYRVRAHGPIQRLNLNTLKRGVTIKGVRYAGMTVHIEKSGQSNHWLKVILHEGKNREVRRVLEHFGLQVNRLIRQSYGPFGLSDIPKGAMVEIPVAQMKKKLPGFFEQ
jgi:23S rRNA pseudouridine2605 synthase